MNFFLWSTGHKPQSKTKWQQGQNKDVWLHLASILTVLCLMGYGLSWCQGSINNSHVSLQQTRSEQTSSINTMKTLVTNVWLQCEILNISHNLLMCTDFNYTFISPDWFDAGYYYALQSEHFFISISYTTIIYSFRWWLFFLPRILLIIKYQMLPGKITTLKVNFALFWNTKKRISQHFLPHEWINLISS